MFSVTVLPVALLVVFQQVSSVPQYVYLVKEFSSAQTCENFPTIKDDPYPCSTSPAGSAFKVQFAKSYFDNKKLIYNSSAGAHGVGAHALLKKHANQVKNTGDCLNKIAQDMCKIVIPACTKDKKKIVSFINQKMCAEVITTCFFSNATSFINSAMLMCPMVPKATAKRISYSDAFGSAGPGNVGTVPIFLFPVIALLF